MLDPETVSAYAGADFDEPHSYFITLLKERLHVKSIGGLALDLGCGPGDITFRFASEFSDIIVHSIDGSAEMINYANKLLSSKNTLKERIIFIQSMLHEYSPHSQYEFIISNSLLHHLPDPMKLWESIKKYSKTGTSVFIMDLCRPKSLVEAERLTKTYTKGEPEILKKEFYNSLLSAFELLEIKKQLDIASLDLSVEKVSDRHIIIYGSV